VFVRQWLEQRFSSELLYRAGLEIQTSLDLDLQQLAERAARDQISVIRERNASNAALVSIQPETGELLAMVGSLNFSDPQIDGQVNVAVRPRQPGSTLKPFTYLASFAKGWSPATVIMDTPTAFGGTYRPNNFDNKFRGPVRVRQALAQSLNIPAVKALDFVGVGDLVSSVHRYGINGLRDPQRYGLSVTLGGGEVSLLDLTYAYQVLANSGNQSGAAVLESERQPGFRELEPIVVLKVTDSTGKVLYQAQPGRKALADPHLTYLITHILADDEARAPTYGRNSPLQLTRPAAVKTGTTDDFHDSWVVGYTPDLLTGIWVGNSDGSPMRDVFGAQGAGRIFNAFMEAALSGKPPRPFARPNGIVERQVCALSGLLATPDCPEKVVELFAPSQVPTKQDDVFKRLDICLINGKLATEHVPPNARESRVFAQFPEPMRAWGLQNGYAAPPSERCDDVYRGIKRAEFAGPPPGSPLRGTVQIVGTALMDDLRSYDLEAGTGLNPAQWMGVTMGRQQGVDNALLGVWDTSAVDPGLYTLRLTLHDGVGNTHQARTQVVVSPSGTPTALPSPNPLGVPATLGLPRPIPTPDVAPTAGPAASAEATRTRPPGASPTVTPSRR
jgi:membrane carboxypeptidase/penicillin-binding protein PbpC